MDYASAIQRVYDHVEKDNVEMAVMSCLRLARFLRDFLNAAVFQRELTPYKDEFSVQFVRIMQDVSDKDAKYYWEKSATIWDINHTLPFSLNVDGGKELKVLFVAVGALNKERELCESHIQDLVSRSAYGWAMTTSMIRLKMRAIDIVQGRIRSFCQNYAITLERQLRSQRKTESFMQATQNEVNNYFKARSDDVFTKLQKASQLVDSTNAEDMSLLLTEVRRAIKAVADYFYPPQAELVMCPDGVQRDLGDDKYLNRLEQYLRTEFPKSTSRELLEAELGVLAVFVRKLSDMAAKGVHADVSAEEAKQGLLGLYMFLFNIISPLTTDGSESGHHA